MEQVARKHNRVGARLDYAINSGAEGLRHIGFPLVDAGGGLPVVLPDPKMGIRDVSQFHGWRMVRIAVKSKNIIRGREDPYPP